MDNKNLKIGGLILAIVAALAVVGVLFARNAGDGQGARTAEQSEVLNALEKVGNDPSKLDPAMKAKFDQMNANNPFSSANRYSTGPGATTTPSSGAGSGAPSGYPTPGGAAAGGPAPGSGSGMPSDYPRPGG